MKREITLTLPATVGDYVFAYIGDAAQKKKRTRYDLVECIVSEISLTKDNPEPLFTVLNYELADYDRFWLHDFGKEIFTQQQYLEMVDADVVKAKKQGGAI